MSGRWRIGLLAVAGACILLAGLAVAAASAVATGEVVAIAVLVIALLALLALGDLSGRIGYHFVELERLRGGIVGLTNGNGVIPQARSDGGPDPELERLRAALAGLAAREAEIRAAPDERLQAVLASVPSVMVVITEDGQVSLVNHLAKRRLGAERVKVGTSVFAALERRPVVEAMELARRQGRPVEASLRSVDGDSLVAQVAHLGGLGGAVIHIDLDGEAPRTTQSPGLEFDLTLFEQPPEYAPIARECPLEALPALVLDTETTGLDVTQDRIVSIGAVRLHGRQKYRQRQIDVLVNPGRPIPARSVAVHGITDAMVGDAGDFGRVYRDIGHLIEGLVLIGHNVPFDLAILRRECERFGIEWSEPYHIDTLRLAGALKLPVQNSDLEGMAQYFGVDIHGRHTALGDALVTADVYLRLLDLLRERGITRLGEALDFSGTAKEVIKRQAEAGW